ncbi:molybdopterin oxidoreductase Fe4S4 region [Ammonifex degensii KC4]|nr:molybdopterin oxidoreductase Fe4S4 region [Ammonifex degensii KC4]
MRKISRREFIKYAGLGVAALSLLGSVGKEDLVFSQEAVSALPKLRRAKETRSVCAYCGCGCGLIVYSEDNRVVYVEGDPDHPINEGSMCPKGIALSDTNTIVNRQHRRQLNPQRITKVLYRAPGSTYWEEKDWDWALREIAKRIKATRDATFEEKDEKGVTVNRTQAIAHLGSASLDNEENYLIHKFLRSLGVINIDHHARL